MHFGARQVEFQSDQRQDVLRNVAEFVLDPVQDRQQRTLERFQAIDDRLRPLGGFASGDVDIHRQSSQRHALFREGKHRPHEGGFAIFLIPQDRNERGGNQYGSPVDR